VEVCISKVMQGLELMVIVCGPMTRSRRSSDL
jgi:hypothetical protein